MYVKAIYHSLSAQVYIKRLVGAAKMASIRYLLFLFMVILADQALGQQPPTVVVTKLSVAGYPLLARQSRQQGDVTARVSLDKNGQVVELDEINGPALLRDAIRVVKDWRFV